MSPVGWRSVESPTAQHREKEEERERQRWRAEPYMGRYLNRTWLQSLVTPLLPCSHPSLHHFILSFSLFIPPSLGTLCPLHPRLSLSQTHQRISSPVQRSGLAAPLAPLAPQTDLLIWVVVLLQREMLPCLTSCQQMKSSEHNTSHLQLWCQSGITVMVKKSIFHNYATGNMYKNVKMTINIVLPSIQNYLYRCEWIFVLVY